MAREYGQYRKMLLEQQEQQPSRIFIRKADRSEEEQAFPWYRIRFYVSLVLFVCYVLLDYTGVSLKSVTSEKILAAIQEDYTQNLQVNTFLAQIMEQVSITEGKDSSEEEDSSPQDSALQDVTTQDAPDANQI